MSILPKQSTDLVHSNGIFHRTNNPKISMELQKTPNSKINLEKEEQSQRHYNPWRQTTL